jgi:hypothetical protein
MQHALSGSYCAADVFARTMLDRSTGPYPNASCRVIQLNEIPTSVMDSRTLDKNI